MNRNPALSTLAVALAIFGGGTLRVEAVNTVTAFTYQGRLTSSGNPAAGSFDFEFKLFDADSGGVQVGTTQTKSAVAVSQGVFTTTLDFGALIVGQALWLEIAARPAGGGGYTLLAPRQALTATPYALSLVPGAVVSGGVAGSTLKAVNTLPDAIAIRAEADNVGGVGVWGQSNQNTGVLGLSVGGRGVWGQSNASTGVYGLSGSGRGVWGQSNTSIGVYGLSSSNIGVWGQSTSDKGVYGVSVSGTGVQGYASSTSGNSAHGVSGTSESSNGFGVVGINTRGGYGVVGRAAGPNGTGVRANAEGSSGPAHGVFATSASSGGYAVYALHFEPNAVAIKGRADSGGGVGVWGESTANTGVYGISGNANGRGVWGANGAGGWAGYFDGKVHVNGTLTKSAGSFRIDHPLDPANQYLNHSFVESPEMKNLYDGVAVLDAGGAAVVTLPDWFAALNGGREFQGDYRYQLSPIGAAMPNLHIAEEIEGNTFRIAGGVPGMKVSWLLTGIRHDPYAETNRFAVEQKKPAGEQGTYLHPELYGQPASLGLGHGRVPQSRDESPEETTRTR